MDKQDKLKEKIRSAQEQADEYLRQIEMDGEHRRDITPEAVESLLQSLEELHVAEEELRVQNAELETTRLSIEAERARYLDLFEFAPDGYLVTDPHGIIKEASQTAGDLLGIRAERLVGKPLATFIGGANRKEFRRQLNHLPEVGQLRDWDFYIEPRNGERLPVAATVAVTSDDVDEVSGLRWMLRDMTQRKQAEEALRESQERYQSLFNSIRDAILVADIERTIINCNPAFVDLFGYSFEEIKGKKTVSVYENREQFEALGQNIAKRRGEGSFLYTVKYQKKSGEVFPGETNVFYLKDRDGEIVGFIGLIRDISERLQAEEELQKHREHLEDLVKERTQELRVAQEQLIRKERLAAIGELAGGIAHELRHPLSVITNISFLLKSTTTDLDEETAEHMAMLDDEVHHANHIITDLLEFARTGEAARVAVSVEQLVADVFRKHPPPDRVIVELNVPDDPPLAFVDPGHLKQVLTNLVENAYQAMPEGGQLSVDCEQDTVDRSLITISDTGVGIPPENMEKIFEPLFTTKQRGIGLGLAVSKSLVEANDGHIEVQSQMGEGTTFRVYLPVTGKTGS